jgi:uncharacterized repeat protein (TIGR03803 family)
VLDAAGNLYGTTYGGGVHGFGTVFELSPMAGGGWTETILHSFNNPGDGYTPVAGLVLDSAGNLYGTTVEGGRYNSGTVFELSPTAGGVWTEKILHHFGSSRTMAGMGTAPRPAWSSTLQAISTAQLARAVRMATERFLSSRPTRPEVGQRRSFIAGAILRQTTPHEPES